MYPLGQTLSSNFGSQTQSQISELKMKFFLQIFSLLQMQSHCLSLQTKFFLQISARGQMHLHCSSSKMKLNGQSLMKLQTHLQRFESYVNPGGHDGSWARTQSHLMGSKINPGLQSRRLQTQVQSSRSKIVPLAHGTRVLQTFFVHSHRASLMLKPTGQTSKKHSSEVTNKGSFSHLQPSPTGL